MEMKGAGTGGPPVGGVTRCPVSQNRLPAPRIHMYTLLELTLSTRPVLNLRHWVFTRRSPPTLNMLIRGISLFAPLFLCFQVNALTQKQHEHLKYMKDQIAGQSGIANTTAFNTTNPLYTGQSDLPAENVTLPLDHFGGNPGKRTVAQRWHAFLSATLLHTPTGR